MGAMSPLTLFYPFGVALGIGVLIGLQREFASDTNPDHKTNDKSFAGTRTFGLMGLVGCTAAFLADELASPLVFPLLLLPAGLFLLVSYHHSAARGKMGLTTEFAALLTILVGALCYWEQMTLAVALGVATFALLSIKLEVRQLVSHLTRADVLATLKFLVITAIILPVLPNDALASAPFDVLNPYKIWLMVVLISGINFLGYVLMKAVGPQRGLSLTGLLSGLVSSTAVTLSMTRTSKSQPNFGKSFALAIVIAWAVMFGRVMVQVAVINPPLLRLLWVSMTVTMLVALAYCAYLYFAPQPTHHPDESAGDNPFELRIALQFGLLYGAILLISRAAQLYFGTQGLYFSSILAGAADVNAITLSMAELSRPSVGGLADETAAQAIILASISNTIVKGGIVLMGGSPTLRRAILPPLIIIATIAGILGLSHW